MNVRALHVLAQDWLKRATCQHVIPQPELGYQKSTAKGNFGRFKMSNQFRRICGESHYEIVDLHLWVKKENLSTLVRGMYTSLHE